MLYYDFNQCTEFPPFFFFKYNMSEIIKTLKSYWLLRKITQRPFMWMSVHLPLHIWSRTAGPERAQNTPG